MTFYLIDDDKNIINILKMIITDRELGFVCGTDESAGNALANVLELRPDIIIVDLLMPDMDGIAFVKQARPSLPHTSFIMLSQVSSKDMIASAYEAGIEFFIQKPINSVEVETIILNVKKSLSMQQTLHKMQHIFQNAIEPEVFSKSSAAPTREPLATLKSILQKLGIIGDIGSKDIITIVDYLLEHRDKINDSTLNHLCSHFSDSPKSMEQRIRRTAYTGMVNLAHLGIEDYGNEIFTEYASTLYNFEQVRREMDYIRGKSNKHGNIKIKNFINALVSYSLNE